MSLELARPGVPDSLPWRGALPRRDASIGVEDPSVFGTEIEWQCHHEAGEGDQPSFRRDDLLYEHVVIDITGDSDENEDEGGVRNCPNEARP